MTPIIIAYCLHMSQNCLAASASSGSQEATVAPHISQAASGGFMGKGDSWYLIGINGHFFVQEIFLPFPFRTEALWWHKIKVSLPQPTPLIRTGAHRSCYWGAAIYILKMKHTDSSNTTEVSSSLPPAQVASRQAPSQILQVYHHSPFLLYCAMHFTCNTFARQHLDRKWSGITEPTWTVQFRLSTSRFAVML